MAKKTKEAKPKEVKPKPAPKPKAPVDPVKTRNLVRLLNTLSLLLVIAAFLLQLFAVLGHRWKSQSTALQPLLSSNYRYNQPNIYEDSRLEQNYGLYTRDVRLFANNDQQLDLRASTRFPRPDDGEGPLHDCLTRTSTLRGAFLTCSEQIVSPGQCHCRRYLYWNFVIFFEIFALILLGVTLFLIALQNTQFHGILKPAAAGLLILAFISLLVGLILILSHLKRETRSIADTYPHIYQRYGERLNIGADSNRAQNYYASALRRAVRRQTHETYRVYSLAPGQHPYNETHFQEYSEQARAWVYRPYSSLSPSGPYVSSLQKDRNVYVTDTPNKTTTPPYNPYGPAIGYDQVFDNTRARIGRSTVLSIIAMVLALLVPLIVIFSWLTNKKLAPSTKTVTTTTVKTEYVPVPQEVTIESVPLQNRSIPTEFDARRPIGDAIVTTQNVRQGPYDQPVIVRDVVIRDDQTGGAFTQEHSFPVNVDTAGSTTYRT